MAAEGTPKPPHIVARRIRSELGRLRARNGHHIFEDLCREYSRLTISRHILPATGPVGRGGDQGRDFETFRSFIGDAVDHGFAAVEPSGRLAFTCTIQQDQIKAKIRSDVKAVMAGLAVIGVYAFCEADVPVADRHDLQQWAQDTYRIELDIIDGSALAENLARPDTFPIAVTYLHLPESLVLPPGFLTLTAPEADSFYVYGTDEINARARTWALNNRYLLCGGVPHCAHGLYLMDDCPGDCRSMADLDHVTVWMPAELADGEGQRAFMLYQPYQTRLPRSAYVYGRAHGLQVEVNRPGDGWYGHSTLAVRMTIPGDSALWPLEREALSLMGRTRHRWGEY
jgi:hypothetical protein